MPSPLTMQMIEDALRREHELQRAEALRQAHAAHAHFYMTTHANDPVYRASEKKNRMQDEISAECGRRTIPNVVSLRHGKEVQEGRSRRSHRA